MATLPISDELAERLQAIARQQNRPVQALLEAMVDQYEALGVQTSQNIEDDSRFQAAKKRIRPKLYARARRYWQQVNDQKRLALNDEELDDQFWLFDEGGIPRLKSDQSKITVPIDAFEETADQAWQRAFKEGQLDEAGSQDIDTRAILRNEYPEYLIRRLRTNNGE